MRALQLKFKIYIILRLEYNKFMYVTYMLDLLGIHQVCYDRTFDGYFQKN